MPSSMSSTLVRLFAYGLLLLQLASVADAGKVSNFCKSLLCYSSSDDAELPARPGSPVCVNPKAPKTASGWNIYKAKSFPTVQDIVADLKLCGIVTADDATTLFYSYAGGLTNAKRFQKANPSLNAKQINDVMPDSWYTALAKFPGTNEAQSPAQQTWVARSSQALAAVSKGKVYLVASPSANIYTVPYSDPKTPWKGAHNVWYDYEFATLQNNAAVTGIYTVNSETLAIDETPTGSWVRSRNPQGDKAGENINANSVTPASIQAKMNGCSAPSKRGTNGKTSSSSADGAACALPAKSSSTATTGTHSKTTSATGKPTTLLTKTKTTSTKAHTSTAKAHATTTKKAVAATTKKAATVTKKPTTSCPKGKKCT